MKEKAELILNGGEKSISSILPVIDDFERAIKTMETAKDVKAVKEGVELIYNKFMAVMAQNGVKVIETKDQPLDTDCLLYTSLLSPFLLFVNHATKLDIKHKKTSCLTYFSYICLNKSA